MVECSCLRQLEGQPCFHWEVDVMLSRKIRCQRSGTCADRTPDQGAFAARSESANHHAATATSADPGEITFHMAFPGAEVCIGMQLGLTAFHFDPGKGKLKFWSTAQMTSVFGFHHQPHCNRTSGYYRYTFYDHGLEDRGAECITRPCITAGYALFETHMQLSAFWQGP